MSECRYLTLTPLSCRNSARSSDIRLVSVVTRTRSLRLARASTDPTVDLITKVVHEAATTQTRRLVLLTGVPGLGRTLLVRSLSKALGLSSNRIQFTPDLLPSDVTGVSVYNQGTGAFEFKPGGIFANIVVGDEITAPPGVPEAWGALCIRLAPILVAEVAPHSLTVLWRDLNAEVVTE